MEKLEPYIEALIFAAEQPIKREEIKYCLENVLDASIDLEVIDESIDALKVKYTKDEFAIEIAEIANGLQFLSKGAFHHVIGQYLKQITSRKLSRVALETLAIIAYKQPVTKSELEKIRGVNCDYAIQKLLDKEMVELLGRSESVGKPLIYGTSQKFMHYFGLKGIDDLPKLKDFAPPANEIGHPAPMEEDYENGEIKDDSEE